MPTSTLPTRSGLVIARLLSQLNGPLFGVDYTKFGRQVLRSLDKEHLYLEMLKFGSAETGLEYWTEIAPVQIPVSDKPTFIGYLSLKDEEDEDIDEDDITDDLAE